MFIQPLIGNPYNGFVNPYYWVDDHPLLYGNIGSLDPSTYESEILSLLTIYGKFSGIMDGMRGSVTLGDKNPHKNAVNCLLSWTHVVEIYPHQGP